MGIGRAKRTILPLDLQDTENKYGWTINLLMSSVANIFRQANLIEGMLRYAHMDNASILYNEDEIIFACGLNQNLSTNRSYAITFNEKTKEIEIGRFYGGKFWDKTIGYKLDNPNSIQIKNYGGSPFVIANDPTIENLDLNAVDNDEMRLLSQKLQIISLGATAAKALHQIFKKQELARKLQIPVNEAEVATMIKGIVSQLNSAIARI